MPLAKGEVYQIRVETRASHRARLRLLVDGLNTLPEKIQAKNVSLASKPPEAVYAGAQRVSLVSERPLAVRPAELRDVEALGREGIDVRSETIVSAIAGDGDRLRRLVYETLPSPGGPEPRHEVVEADLLIGAARRLPSVNSQEAIGRRTSHEAPLEVGTHLGAARASPRRAPRHGACGRNPE